MAMRNITFHADVDTHSYIAVYIIKELLFNKTNIVVTSNQYRFARSVVSRVMDILEATGIEFSYYDELYRVNLGVSSSTLGAEPLQEEYLRGRDIDTLVILGDEPANMKTLLQICPNIIFVGDSRGQG